MKQNPELAGGPWLDLGTGSGAIAIGLASILPAHTQVSLHSGRPQARAGQAEVLHKLIPIINCANCTPSVKKSLVWRWCHSRTIRILAELHLGLSHTQQHIRHCKPHGRCTLGLHG